MSFSQPTIVKRVVALGFTPGGPTTATITGGGSSGVRSTIGTCSLFSAIYNTIISIQSRASEMQRVTSVDRRATFAARRLLAIINARGFLPFVEATPFFLTFFLSAFVPE